MSRRQTRARRRRARIEQAEAEFFRVRGDPAAFAGYLDRLAASDTPIWPIAEAASRSSPLDAAERAMVAQAVAPHLAGKTPGSVLRRHTKGAAPQVSRIKPGG
jgi:hypothetical protein